ncbi:MAG: DUF2817 domain-containing protein [Gammaproteobacteria bacterium]|nr:DUF2817 domain-containing protein [Gammaproteobacteria bacterium]NVK88431.1 DUF2817 domain-containing protein [Gammaproteobacteria bacterium]
MTHQLNAHRERKLRDLLQTRCPELVELERLLVNFNELLSFRVLTQVEYQAHQFPIYSLTLGNPAPEQPTLLLTAGVHGIERIGVQVVLAQLKVWLERLKWERSLQNCLQQMSITLIPIVNPVGLFLNRRSNGKGVDLMRNAPIESREASFLVSGQKWTPKLPWYRGDVSHMEPENQVLREEIERLTARAPMVISVDCHSGFGVHDRLWFPYAYRRRPMQDIAPMVALKLLWESSYPNHQYIFEPQSNHYLTHGDLWDYFYKQFGRKQCRFLPLTLELGSWAWVRKRPLQLLRFDGLFNPLVPHRQQRAMRRHLPLMDFFRHAVHSYQQWLPGPAELANLKQMANSLWYR